MLDTDKTIVTIAGFMHCTRPNGAAIWVRQDRIQMVFREFDGTRLVFSGGADFDSVTVIESIDAVFDSMNEVATTKVLA